MSVLLQATCGENLLFLILYSYTQHSIAYTIRFGREAGGVVTYYKSVSVPIRGEFIK